MSDPERVDELLRSWQDGDATAVELSELHAALQADPSLRRRLVDSVLVESALYGRFARQQVVAPARRWRALELAAAALLVAASGIAVGRLWLGEKPPLRPAELVVSVSPVKKSPKNWSPLLDRATLSLAEAVERALAATKGGTPIEAELEEDDGLAVYSVRIAKDGDVRELEIDAATGAVLDDDPEGVDATRLATMEGPGLLEAVAKALARLPGRVVKAEREPKGEGAAVEIEVWSVGNVYEAKVLQQRP